MSSEKFFNLKSAIGLYANCAAPPGMRPALAAKIMRTIRCIVSRPRLAAFPAKSLALSNVNRSFQVQKMAGKIPDDTEVVPPRNLPPKNLPPENPESPRYDASLAIISALEPSSPMRGKMFCRLCACAAASVSVMASVAKAML